LEAQLLRPNDHPQRVEQRGGHRDGILPQAGADGAGRVVGCGWDNYGETIIPSTGTYQRR